jgi:PAS domain S-box-containing protein
MQLLYVEDNDYSATIACGLFSESAKASLKVDHVRTVDEMLDRVKSHVYQVLLINSNSLDKKGCDALDLLIGWHGHLPIIIISDIDDDAAAKKYLGIGVQDYLVVTDMNSGMLGRALSNAIERKKIEGALKGSESKYREIVQNANEAIVVAQDGVIQFCNPMSAELIGEALSSLEGKDFIGFIHPDDRVLVAESHLRRLAGEEFKHSYTFRIQRPSGEVRWVQINAVMVDWGGKPATLNFLTDMSEQKKVEHQLEFERDQLWSIFNGIDEVIYIADLETYEILFVNKYCRELLGGDPVGKPCYVALQGLDVPCDFCTNDVIVNLKGETYQWEFHNLKVDRDYLVFDRTIRWLDGRNARFELAIDISDLKRSEQEMKKRIVEIERLNDVMFGREKRVVSLKSEVNVLLRELGRKTKYIA